MVTYLRLVLGRFYCTFTALLRKSLIINGAGEGNRTLVYVVVKSGKEWLRFKLRVHRPMEHIFPFGRATYQAIDEFYPFSTG